jgi:hypothetical protein
VERKLIGPEPKVLSQDNAIRFFTKADRLIHEHITNGMIAGLGDINGPTAYE